MSEISDGEGVKPVPTEVARGNISPEGIASIQGEVVDPENTADSSEGKPPQGEPVPTKKASSFLSGGGISSMQGTTGE
jgi:hypothetical protein